MSDYVKTPLEFRERGTNGEHATEKLVALGTEQPVVLIEFIGTPGQQLDRIVIESTGWEPEALASLFENIAASLRQEPESIEVHDD
jgi:hypothetical protein